MTAINPRAGLPNWKNFAPNPSCTKRMQANHEFDILGGEWCPASKQHSGSRRRNMNHIVFSPTSCWKCEDCAVSNRSICRAASQEAMQELGRLSHLREFRKGQVIVAQGDDATIVGNVVTGVVKLTKMSVSGQQQIVGLLFPSDFFGRAFSDNSRFSYEAATDVSLCCIDRQAFESFLLRFPEVKHELLLTVLDELDATREWAAMTSAHTTMERIAVFLFILSKRSAGSYCENGTKSERTVIALPVGRRDIAAYLGTTPETLSRNIQTLVRKHVIRPLDANSFELLDSAGLVDHTSESRDDLEAMLGVAPRIR
ncbi:Crp/Fnr family transcriptional regulator [Oricola nitratireducens]|uniref:Crp/Fnr family transcriptional regulator n=1 Tax=Oricola nitratireducens TaxID=2775868 RepID=UPI001868AFD0|nr:Crp/Fnr family transcriptional regulator [Oricola nitratireducens]